MCLPQFPGPGPGQPDPGAGRPALHGPEQPVCGGLAVVVRAHRQEVRLRPQGLRRAQAVTTGRAGGPAILGKCCTHNTVYKGQSKNLSRCVPKKIPKKAWIVAEFFNDFKLSQ